MPSLRPTLPVLTIAVTAAVFITMLAASLLMPPEKLRAERDAEREHDVQTLAHGVASFLADPRSAAFAELLPVELREICRATYPQEDCARQSGIHLTPLLRVTLNDIPYDPLLPPSGTGTQYWLARSATGQITVRAPLAEDRTVTVSE